MMQDDFPLLDLMMQDQQGADPVHRPGPYWQGYQRRTYAALKAHGVAAFRSHPDIGKGFADTLTIDPFSSGDQQGWKHMVRRRLMALPGFRQIEANYLRLIRHYLTESLRYKSEVYDLRFRDIVKASNLADAVPDTTAGGCLDVVSIDGQPYSSLYIEFLVRLMNFQAAGVDFAAHRRVMEIGGGFGAMVHLLAGLHPNIRKVIYLDIPPMIYIATQYLKHHYGAAVVDYRASRNMTEIRFRDDDSLEIYCLCPWQIDRVGQVDLDLLWNAASFSEMTPAIVRNYAQHAKRLLTAPNAELCLLLNKKTKSGSYEIAMPDSIREAFAPAFRLEPIAQHYHSPSKLLHWHGQRT